MDFSLRPRERERERDRKRQRERQTDRQTERLGKRKRESKEICILIVVGFEMVSYFQFMVAIVMLTTTDHVYSFSKK